MSNAQILLMTFWPLVCAITYAITVPIAKRRQAVDPDYDPRKLVLGTLIGVGTTLGWRMFGRADE